MAGSRIARGGRRSRPKEMEERTREMEERNKKRVSDSVWDVVI